MEGRPPEAIIRATATPDGGEGPETARVIGNVDFVLGFQSVIDMHARPGGEGAYRIYAGYAGWSAGQLAAEIENGGWHLTADSANLVFADEPGEVWSHLMRKLRGRWI